MSIKQELYKKDLIKIIHILKNKKALDDEMYKDILSQRYGVTSSKNLSIDELKDFALVLGYKGYESKKAKFNREVDFHCKTTKRGTSTTKQIATILKMWQEKARDKSITALIKFSIKIVKYAPLKLGILSKQEAQKLILALNNLK